MPICRNNARTVAPPRRAAAAPPVGRPDRRARRPAAQPPRRPLYVSVAGQCLPASGSVGECPSCPQMHELLEEIVALSPSLNLEYFDFYTQPEEAQSEGVDRIPCITFKAGEQNYPNIKYYGVPSGYEFAAFLEDIISISRNVSPLQLPTRKALRRLDKEVTVKVFVTPG